VEKYGQDSDPTHGFYCGSLCGIGVITKCCWYRQIHKQKYIRKTKQQIFLYAKPYD